jgi:hypothetical protein
MKTYKFLEKENWFKHDFRAREDKKLLKLKLKYKSSAPIGIFWQLVEMIYENAGFLDYDLDIISYNVGDDSEIVKDVIDSCFIIIEDNKLTHETIVEQLDKREEGYVAMVEKKSKAGLASAAAKKLAKELQQSDNDSSTYVEDDLTIVENNLTNVDVFETDVKHNSTRVESGELRVESRETELRDEIILNSDHSCLADQVNTDKTFAESFNDNKEEATKAIFKHFNFKPAI